MATAKEEALEQLWESLDTPISIPYSGKGKPESPIRRRYIHNGVWLVSRLRPDGGRAFQLATEEDINTTPHLNR